MNSLNLSSPPYFCVAYKMTIDKDPYYFFIFTFDNSISHSVTNSVCSVATKFFFNPVSTPPPRDILSFR